MGYSTSFTGRIEIEPPLNQSEIDYLTRFSDTRRMHRVQGPFYIIGDEVGVFNANKPPPGQPHLWCDFYPTEDGTALIWNESEGTRCATAWIQYLITRFLMKGAVTQDSTQYFDLFKNFQYNHILNGVLEAQGDWPKDRWKLIVKDNETLEEKYPDWKRGV